MILHEGMLYFSTWVDARDHAVKVGASFLRIYRFDLGWAIQTRHSGPYVGPK